MKRSGLIILLFGMLAFGCASAVTVTFQGADANGQPLAANSTAQPALYLVKGAKFDNKTLERFYAFAVNKLPEVGLICDEFSVNEAGLLEVQGKVVSGLSKQQSNWWNIWFTKYCNQLNDGITLIFNNKDFLVKNADTNKAYLTAEQKDQVVADVAGIGAKLKPITAFTASQYSEFTGILSNVRAPAKAAQ
ncbi:MAG: hypothetical protein KAS93_03190 [Gammaproteobacteria bacterium]|nr:hypothetical protein [Gammaproteobacteria bacterium]